MGDHSNALVPISWSPYSAESTRFVKGYPPKNDSGNAVAESYRFCFRKNCMFDLFVWELPAPFLRVESPDPVTRATHMISPPELPFPFPEKSLSELIMRNSRCRFQKIIVEFQRATVVKFQVFLNVWPFHMHSLYIFSADTMVISLEACRNRLNRRWTNVKSMHVKRPDPQQRLELYHWGQ